MANASCMEQLEHRPPSVNVSHLRPSALTHPKRTFSCHLSRSELLAERLISTVEQRQGSLDSPRADAQVLVYRRSMLYPPLNTGNRHSSVGP